MRAISIKPLMYFDCKYEGEKSVICSPNACIYVNTSMDKMVSVRQPFRGIR